MVHKTTHKTEERLALGLIAALIVLFGVAFLGRAVIREIIIPTAYQLIYSPSINSQSQNEYNKIAFPISGEHTTDEDTPTQCSESIASKFSLSISCDFYKQQTIKLSDEELSSLQGRLNTTIKSLQNNGWKFDEHYGSQLQTLPSLFTNINYSEDAIWPSMYWEKQIGSVYCQYNIWVEADSPGNATLIKDFDCDRNFNFLGEPSY